VSKSPLRNFEGGEFAKEPGPIPQSRAPVVGSITPIPFTVTGDRSFMGDLAADIRDLQRRREGKPPIRSGVQLVDGPGFGGGQVSATPVTSVMRAPVFFQFYPETISDNRHANTIDVPLILSQNPSPAILKGSARNISFTAVFAQERAVNTGQGEVLADWDKYNFDVALAVQACRSFIYPIPIELGPLGSVLSVTPQRILLTLPGTKIGIRSDSIECIMQEYAVDYLSFFPDGRPRIATVGMSFMEVAALASLNNNVSRSDFESVLQRYSNAQFGAIGAEVQGENGVLGWTKDIDVTKVSINQQRRLQNSNG
jgi:hypothetical protein